MGQGHAVQYVAGTMPVAVPHRPDRADIVEVELVWVARAGAEFDTQEARGALHIRRRDQHADNLDALPEGFRLSIPGGFDQRSFADVAKSRGRVELDTWLTHGGVLLPWLDPGTGAAAVGDPAPWRERDDHG